MKKADFLPGNREIGLFRQSPRDKDIMKLKLIFRIEYSLYVMLKTCVLKTF